MLSHAGRLAAYGVDRFYLSFVMIVIFVFIPGTVLLAFGSASACV